METMRKGLGTGDGSGRVGSVGGKESLEEGVLWGGGGGRNVCEKRTSIL